MNLSEKELKIVEEIKTKYGRIIDLEDSPAVIIEILRNYEIVFGTDGTGGVSAVGIEGISVSSIAVVGVVTGDNVGIQIESIIRELMESKIEMKRMSRQINLMWIALAIGFALTIAINLIG